MEGIITLALFLGFYFLPSIIAFSNKKDNATAITVLNTFLGFTVLGWVLALVWAVTKDKK